MKVEINVPEVVSLFKEIDRNKFFLVRRIIFWYFFIHKLTSLLEFWETFIQAYFFLNVQTPIAKRKKLLQTLSL
jgi:hypothetical protein